MRENKKNENMLYASALKKYRLQNNMTQEQVAQIIETDTKYISQLEFGVSRGSISTLIKLCKAYNVTPNDILYDLYKDTPIVENLDKFNSSFSKLSVKDKELVLMIINNLLNR